MMCAWNMNCFMVVFVISLVASLSSYCSSKYLNKFYFPFIQWIGILFFLTTTALTVAEKRETKSKTKVSTTKSASTSKTLEKSSKPTEASSTSARTTTKTLKSAKSLDSRGKRTLYDFGNAGFLYPQVAARRAGYSAEPRTSYYPTNGGYFNGENAIGGDSSNNNSKLLLNILSFCFFQLNFLHLPMPPILSI